MKTDLELLKELLDNYRNCRDNKRLQFGLCFFIRIKEYYSYNESIRLQSIIDTNRPKIVHKNYFFPPGDVPSRIKYLKKLIKKYKK